MKYFALIGFLTFTLSITTELSAYPKHNSQSAPEQSQQTDEFIKRWKDEKTTEFLDGATWGLTHNYSNFSRVQEVLKIMQDYFAAIAKYEQGDRSPLSQMGGVKAFKDKMAEMLSDEDQAVSSYAATILGICGDRAYAKQIANLLKERTQEDKHPRFDRGRAACALGVLGAKEYASDLAALLHSS